MEIENKKTKIASFNSIRNRYLSAIAADKIQMEHQVRKFCVTPMIELVWGFVAGFGETGTYTEEEDYAVGTSKVLADNVLHCYDGKVVVESKGPNESLDDHIPQLKSYVKLACACVGIITNGIDWRFYVASRTGDMLDKPFREISISDASDKDIEFFVSFFDPKHTVNASAKRKEQESKEEKENEREKIDFFLMGLKDFTEKPTDEWIKDRIRAYEKIQSVSSAKLDDYKKVVVPAVTLALRDEICKAAIIEEKKKSNRRNRTNAGEYAIYNGCRVYAKQKGIGLRFVDDDDARFSHLEEANTGRKVMYIIGDVDEDTGWTLKGIAFPNRTKGKGTLIQCSTVEEVDGYLGTLMWVVENIERPIDEWASLYDRKAVNGVLS
jgi:hypothetical protein